MAQVISTGDMEAKEDLVIVELYENQRWYPIGHWRGKLMPTDRPHYSSKDGKEERRKDEIPLPPRYEWVDEWVVYIDEEHNDEEGWEYSFDFPAEPYSKECSTTDCVRRRRWRRTMKKSARIGDMESFQAALANPEPNSPDYCVIDKDGNSVDGKAKGSFGGDSSSTAASPATTGSLASPASPYQFHETPKEKPKPAEVNHSLPTTYTFGEDAKPEALVGRSDKDDIDKLLAGFMNAPPPAAASSGDGSK